MRIKGAILFAAFLVLFGLAACRQKVRMPEPAHAPTPLPEGEPVAATRVLPALSAETPNPLPTITPAPAATPVPVPSQTPIPTATAVAGPAASLLFVRNHALQQWQPQMGTLRVLVEGVHPPVQFAGDVAVFLREVPPEASKALLVFHIPTQSEAEVLPTPSTLFARLNGRSLTISPNGRWLAYVSAAETGNMPTLTVHEITLSEQQVTVTAPVFTATLASPWSWPYDILSWATPHELSWTDKNGIWTVDLAAATREPVIAVAPSTNTYQVPSLNPADQDKEPGTFYTNLWPHAWSPDGRYLLVVEYFFESGVFRVIERGTNRSVEIPDSGVGPLSDEVLWMDEQTLLHFRTQRGIYIWHVDLDQDPAVSLENSIPLPAAFWELRNLRVVEGHLRFSAADHDAFYDLDLESGRLSTLVSTAVADATLHWSPDNQYVLWSYREVVDDERIRPVRIANLDDGIPQELDALFGLDSCCWHWYE